jgi:hypothetical protein
MYYYLLLIGIFTCLRIISTNHFNHIKPFQPSNHSNPTCSGLEPNFNRTLTELFRLKYGSGTAQVLPCYDCKDEMVRKGFYKAKFD